ncbi:MAG TPA: hypothetical protein VLJ59_11925 [Mycobacteriales bacterium]|nr:hypothetical protein [Mycobacteriales bacterium]
MIDSLGDVGAALSDGRPESLSRLYRDLRLELRYQLREHAVVVTASPRVLSLIFHPDCGWCNGLCVV